MNLTDDQIEKHLNSKEPIYLSNREIESIWKDANNKQNMELLKLKSAYHTSILEGIWMKAIKVDKEKADKVNDIRDFIIELNQVQLINNMQIDIIESLRLQLFSKDRKIKSLEDRISRLIVGL